MGVTRNRRFWLEKLNGREPLGGPRHRWKDNTRMDLGEIGWKDVDWMHPP
jgi:hypothetical protein